MYMKLMDKRLIGMDIRIIRLFACAWFCAVWWFVLYGYQMVPGEWVWDNSREAYMYKGEYVLHLFVGCLVMMGMIFGLLWVIGRKRNKNNKKK